MNLSHHGVRKHHGVRGDLSIYLPDVLVANCGGPRRWLCSRTGGFPGFFVAMSVMQELQTGAHLLPPHRDCYVSLSSLSAEICNDTYSLRLVVMC
jgi:hypothetical protein